MEVLATPTTIAIVTEFVPGTNAHGSRIRATGAKGERVYLPYDHGKNAEGNHRAAALAMCERMARKHAAPMWSSGTWMGGTIYTGAMVWVRSEES